jgi:hypothetical protein
MVWPTSASRSKPLLARVNSIIHRNRRLTVQEVAEEVEISIGLCHTILTEDLGMLWVSAKFVLRHWTDDQKPQ